MIFSSQWLIKQRNKSKLHKALATVFLLLRSVDIGPGAKISDKAFFRHHAIGCVVHDCVTIEDGVQIFQNVTLGRGDVWQKIDESDFKGIVVKKNATVGAGTKVMCSKGVLIIGEGTIIGANSVLTRSTGDWEIWAGSPARKIRDRDDKYVGIGHAWVNDQN